MAINLAVGSKLPGVVTHVDFKGGICEGFMQVCDASLVERVSETVQDEALKASNIPCNVGDLVFALFSEDNSWYRAKVLSIEATAVQVFFVDYGNVENVDTGNIRMMPKELNSIPYLAIKGVLSNIAPGNPGGWTEEEKEQLKNDILNIEHTIEITALQNRMPLIQLYNNTTPITHGNSASKQSPLKPGTSVSVQLGQKCKAYLSYVDGANKFWIQLAQNETVLEDLMSDIAAIEPSCAQLTNPSAGTICLSTFSEDGASYRSNILTVNGNQCLVQFVDYGNSESKSITELKSLPEKFKKVPFQSLKCCYKQTRINPSALEEHLHELAAADNGITIKMLSKSGDVFIVEIEEIETLQQDGAHSSHPMKGITAKQLNSTVVYDVCLSSVEHPGKFYVQLIEDATEIDQMMVQLLAEYKSSECLSPLTVGAYGNGKLSDEQCYRVKVLSVQGSKACIQSVDFGHQEFILVNSLRALSSATFEPAAFAVECTVDITKTQPRFWSEEEIRILEALESKIPLVAKVTSSRDSFYQLDLYDTRDRGEDRYINAELLGVGSSKKAGTIKKAFVPLAKSPEIFVSPPPPEVAIGNTEMICVTAIFAPDLVFCQLTKTDQKKLEQLQNDLYEAYEYMGARDSVVENPALGNNCCTKYTDGGWYRGIITSVSSGKVKVAFTDFGDEVLKTPSDLKELMPEFGVLPQQCILCQIPHLPNATKNLIENLLLNKPVEIKLKNPIDGVFPTYAVEFTNHKNNKEIVSKLIGSQKASKGIRGKVNIQKGDVFDSVRPDQGYADKVFITHVVDPSHFHLQLVSMGTKLDAMMDQLETIYGSLAPGENLLLDCGLGSPCVAKYSADNAWYRAKVTGLLKDGSVEVLFVDYGNTEVMGLEELKQAKPEFLGLPAQAILASLNGISPGQSFWSPAHIAQFEDLVLDKNFDAVFEGQSFEGDALYIVTLFDDTGESINQKFGKSTNTLQETPNRKTFGSGMNMTISVTNPAEKPNGGFGGGGFQNRSRNTSGNNERSYEGDWSGDGNRGGFRSKGSFGNRSRDGDRGDCRPDFRENKDEGFGGRQQEGGFTRRPGTNENAARSFGRQEGGGFRRQEEGGFGRRDGGGFRKQEEGGFGRREGGGFRKQEEGGFGRREGGSFRRQEEGGFGRREGGGFGSREGGGFRRQEEGGFGRQEGGGFGRRNNNSFEGSGQHSGGFGNRSRGSSEEHENRRDDAGFGGKPRRGGFGGRDGGGFGNRSREGNFGRQSDGAESSGGFGGKSGGGGFGGKPRGGFESRPREDGGDGDWGSRPKSGFGGRPRGNNYGEEGGTGGFKGRTRDGGDRDSGFHRGGGDNQNREGRHTGGLGGSTGNDSGGFGNRNSGFGQSTLAQEPIDDWDNDIAGPPPETNAPSKSRFRGISQPSQAQIKDLEEDFIFQSQKLNPVTSSKVYIVYSKSPSEFWCQLVDKAAELQTLMDKMHQHYDPLGQEEQKLDSITMGMSCVAKYSEDDQWYRAEVVSVDEGTVKVHFVDFGNEDNVDRNSLKAMTTEFMVLPSQAVRCILSGVKPASADWSESACSDFCEFTMDKEMKCTIVSSVGGTYVVDLEDSEGKDASLKLHESGHCELAASVLEVKQAEVSEHPYPSLNIQLGCDKEVVISWITNPLLFWVQPTENEAILEEMTDGIQKDYSSGEYATKTMTSVSKGMPVVALYAEDNSWYRAVVESVAGNNITVTFIDYGNSDSVPLDSLREVSPALMKTPAQASCCCLANVKPLGDRFNPDAKDVMESLVTDPVSCKFMKKEGLKFVVQITASGVDLARELKDAAVVKIRDPKTDDCTGEKQETINQPVTKSNVASWLEFPAPPEMPLGTKEQVYISQINSLSDFYCQLVRSAEDLESLMDRIQNESSQLKVLEVLTEGACCCAKFSEDGLFYRAKIIGVHGDEAEVVFVDYGNKEKVQKGDLKSLSGEFFSLPTQASPCTLAASLTNGNLAAFQELTLEKELTVEVIRDDMPLEVSIMLEDGQLLSSSLLSSPISSNEELPPVEETKEEDEATVPFEHYLPLMEQPQGETKFFTSFVVSPEKFYLQLATQESILDELTAKLQDKYSSKAVPLREINIGSPCCSKYQEDESWYRGRVVNIDGNTCQVLFVDYGNSDSLDKSNVCELSKDLGTQPCLAIECSLDNVTPCSGSWTSEAIEHFESLIMDHELTGMFCDTKKIRLANEDGDVGEQMVAAGFALPVPTSDPLQKIQSPQNPPPGNLKAFVTHTDEFIHIQLSSNEDQLNKLVEEVQETAEILDNVDGEVKVGEHYLALYNEDGSWYRALVTNVEGESVTVRFVDYGNCDITTKSSLKKLDSQTASHMAFAYPCALNGQKLTPAETLKVQELVADKEVLVSFSDSTEEPFQVEITLDDKDLRMMLAATMEKQPEISGVPTEAGDSSGPTEDTNFVQDQQGVEAKVVQDLDDSCQSMKNENLEDVNGMARGETSENSDTENLLANTDLKTVTPVRSKSPQKISTPPPSRTESDMDIFALSDSEAALIENLYGEDGHIAFDNKPRWEDEEECHCVVLEDAEVFALDSSSFDIDSITEEVDESQPDSPVVDILSAAIEKLSETENLEDRLIPNVGIDEFDMAEPGTVEKRNVDDKSNSTLSSGFVNSPSETKKFLDCIASVTDETDVDINGNIKHAEHVHTGNEQEMNQSSTVFKCMETGTHLTLDYCNDVPEAASCQPPEPPNTLSHSEIKEESLLLSYKPDTEISAWESSVLLLEEDLELEHLDNSGLASTVNLPDVGTDIVQADDVCDQHKPGGDQRYEDENMAALDTTDVSVKTQDLGIMESNDVHAIRTGNVFGENESQEEVEEIERKQMWEEPQIRAGLDHREETLTSSDMTDEYCDAKMEEIQDVEKSFFGTFEENSSTEFEDTCNIECFVPKESFVPGEDVPKKVGDSLETRDDTSACNYPLPADADEWFSEDSCIEVAKAESESTELQECQSLTENDEIRFCMKEMLDVLEGLELEEHETENLAISFEQPKDEDASTTAGEALITVTTQLLWIHIEEPDIYPPHDSPSPFFEEESFQVDIDSDNTDSDSLSDQESDRVLQDMNYSALPSVDMNQVDETQNVPPSACHGVDHICRKVVLDADGSGVCAMQIIVEEEEDCSGSESGNGDGFSTEEIYISDSDNSREDIIIMSDTCIIEEADKEIEIHTSEASLKASGLDSNAHKHEIDLETNEKGDDESKTDVQTDWDHLNILESSGDLDTSQNVNVKMETSDQISEELNILDSNTCVQAVESISSDMQKSDMHGEVIGGQLLSRCLQTRMEKSVDFRDQVEEDNVQESECGQSGDKELDKNTRHEEQQRGALDLQCGQKMETFDSKAEDGDKQERAQNVNKCIGRDILTKNNPSVDTNEVAEKEDYEIQVDKKDTRVAIELSLTSNEEGFRKMETEYKCEPFIDNIESDSCKDSLETLSQSPQETSSDGQRGDIVIESMKNLFVPVINVKEHVSPISCANEVGTVQKGAREEMQETVSGDLKETVGKDLKEGVSQDLQETVSQDLQEVVSQDLQEAVSQDLLETVMKNLQEALNDNFPQEVSQDLQEAVMKNLQETVSHYWQEAVSHNLPYTFSQDLQETVSQHLQDTVSQDLQEAVSDNLPQAVNQHLQETVSPDLQETLSQVLQEPVSDNLPQAVSLDLLETDTQDLQKTVMKNLEEALMKNMQEALSDILQETVCQDLQEIVSQQETVSYNFPRAVGQILQEAVSQDLQEAVSQDLQKSVSDNFPQAASQILQEAVSQDLQETESQDLLEIVMKNFEEALKKNLQQAFSDNLPQALIQILQKTVSQDLQEVVSDNFPQAEIQDLQEVVTQDLQETVCQDLQETVSHDRQEKVSQDLQETVSQDLQEVVSDNLPQAEIQDLQEVVSQDLQEVVSQDLQEVVSQNLQEKVSQDLHETVCQDLQEVVSQDLQETVSQDLQEVVSQDLQESVSQDLQETDSQDLQEKVSQDLQETVSQDLQEVVSDNLPQAEIQDLQESVSQDLQETDSQDLQEKVSQDLQETVSQDLQEVVSDNFPQAVIQILQKTVSQDLQEVVSDNLPQAEIQDLQEVVSQDFQETVCQDLQEVVSQDLQEVVSQDLQEKLSQDLQEAVSQDLQETVCQDLQEAVSQDLQEAVSQDLQETVCQDLQEAVSHGLIQYCSQDDMTHLETDTPIIISDCFLQDQRGILIASKEELDTGLCIDEHGIYHDVKCSFLSLDVTGCSECELIVESQRMQETENEPVESCAGAANTDIHFVTNLSQLTFTSMEVGARELVTVDHVDTPSCFYVVNITSKPSFDRLLDEMLDFYSLESDKCKVDDPEDSSICAVFVDEDESWYRCQVKDFLKENNYLVQLLDHGNVLEVNGSSLRKLPVQFASLPVLATKCGLAGVRSMEGLWNEVVGTTLAEWTADKKLTVDVLMVNEDGFHLVDLMDMGLSLSNKLIQEGLAVTATTPVKLSKKTKRVFSDSSEADNSMGRLKLEEVLRADCALVEREYGEPQLEVGACVTCVVTHIETPEDFNVQLCDNMDKLQSLMGAMQSVYSIQSESLPALDIGDPCIAPFSDDGLFYRGVVSGFESDSVVKVHFVDYGNTENVTLSDLRSISDEHKILPKQALRCGLHGVQPTDGLWSPECIAFFEEWTGDQELEVTVCTVAFNGHLEVQIGRKDVTLSHVLCEKGFASLTEAASPKSVGDMDSAASDTDIDNNNTFSTEDYCNAIVGSILPYKEINLECDKEYAAVIIKARHPGSISLRLTEQEFISVQADIEKKIASLNVDSSKMLPESLIEGRACLAQSSDGHYYRALVLHVDDKVEVNFVDNGNVEEINGAQICLMPDDLLSFPAQELHLSLTDIRPLAGEDSWSLECIDYLQEYTENNHDVTIYLDRQVKGRHYCGSIMTGGVTFAHTLAEIGLVDAVPNSSLYDQLHQEQEETSFNELSMNRQNSYGSFDDTTDADASQTVGDSVLETTGAEDSFVYLKPKEMEALRECDERVEESEERSGYYQEEQPSEDSASVEGALTQDPALGPPRPPEDISDSNIEDKGNVAEVDAPNST